MRRIACLSVLVGLMVAHPALAAEKAQPKRATAEDLATVLSSKPGQAVGKARAGLPGVTEAAVPDALAGAKVERRVVEGLVSTVTKRAISVEYETKGDGSYEMLLPFGAQVAVEGVKTLTELKYGDRVKVGIEQTYREGAMGERIVLKTEALVVALVQRAPEALSDAGATTP